MIHNGEFILENTVNKNIIGYNLVMDKVIRNHEEALKSVTETSCGFDLIRTRLLPVCNDELKNILFKNMFMKEADKIQSFFDIYHNPDRDKYKKDLLDNYDSIIFPKLNQLKSESKLGFLIKSLSLDIDTCIEIFKHLGHHDGTTTTTTEERVNKLINELNIKWIEHMKEQIKDEQLHVLIPIISTSANFNDIFNPLIQKIKNINDYIVSTYWAIASYAHMIISDFLDCFAEDILKKSSYSDFSSDKFVVSKEDFSVDYFDKWIKSIKKLIEKSADTSFNSTLSSELKEIHTSFKSTYDNLCKINTEKPSKGNM
jgi:hypothetical protein